MVSRWAMAILVLMCSGGASLAGCIGTAQLTPPRQALDRPGAEPPPDTLVDSTDNYAETDPSALIDFGPILAHDGTWVDDTELGTVWVPNPRAVGAGFMPYVTAGHWTYLGSTTWISDYAWGWLPFHYGRWVWSSAHGWAWIAGRTYAPAWVVWRTAPPELDLGYVGWAPTPPKWTWRSKVAVAVEPAIEASFVFCPTSNLFSRRLSHWIVASEPGFSIAKRTEPMAALPPPEALGLPPFAMELTTTERDGLALAQRYADPATLPPEEHKPLRHWVRMAPPIRLPRPEAPHTYRLTFQ